MLFLESGVSHDPMASLKSAQMRSFQRSTRFNVYSTLDGSRPEETVLGVLLSPCGLLALDSLPQYLDRLKDIEIGQCRRFGAKTTAMPNRFLNIGAPETRFPAPAIPAERHFP